MKSLELKWGGRHRRVSGSAIGVLVFPTPGAANSSFNRQRQIACLDDNYGHKMLSLMTRRQFGMFQLRASLVPHQAKMKFSEGRLVCVKRPCTSGTMPSPSVNQHT